VEQRLSLNINYLWTRGTRSTAMSWVNTASLSRTDSRPWRAIGGTPLRNNPLAPSVEWLHGFCPGGMVTPEEFRAWRRRMGWTQAEAARQLGISRRHVVSLEQGRHADGRAATIERYTELACAALERLPDTRAEEP